MAFDSYFVMFTGYIDERKRPENFPHKIYVKETYNEVEGLPHLQGIVNKRFVELALSSGLVVIKNEDEILEEGKLTFDKRMFVPWHMITHMTLDVKIITPKSRPHELLVPPAISQEEPTKEVVN